MSQERSKKSGCPPDNSLQTSRRAFGALVLGLGMSLSNATDMLSSPVRRDTDATEQTQTQPPTQAQISTSAVERALANADEHSRVRLQPGIIEPTSTLTIPGWVGLDATGVTIRPQHSDPVISCGPRGRLFRGKIEMGNSGAVGVLNNSAIGDSYVHKWGAGPFGTVITAEPGSGATAHEVRKPAGADNNLFQTPIYESHGVDTPLRLRSQGSSGFITSVNATMIASDFEQAIVVDGDRNCSNHMVRYELRPSGRSIREKLIDGPSRRVVSEGRISNPGRLDELVRVKEVYRTQNGSALGHHGTLSYDGLSSDGDPGLVTDTTDAQDTQVIDFSDAWGPRQARRSAIRVRPSIEAEGRSGSRSRGRLRGRSMVRSQARVQSAPRAITAEPGGLQSALNRGASQDAIVRTANGGQFDLGGVTAPAGVTLDARGGEFTLSGGQGMTFESGAGMVGGYVDVGSFSGDVFTIEAGAGETVSGQTGPLDTFVDSRPDTSPSTGLRLHAYDGGMIDGIRAYVRTFRCGRVLDVHAEAGSAIGSCDIYGLGGQTMEFCYQHGRGEQAYNTWFGHNQPLDDESRSQWHIDAPNAHDEWFCGYLWDGKKMRRPWVVWIERSSGGIKYANPQTKHIGLDNEHFKFADESGAEGNRPVPLPLLESEEVSAIGFPERRFNTWRFVDAAANRLSA